MMAAFGASDVVVRHARRSRRGTAMVVGVLLPVALGVVELADEAKARALVSALDLDADRHVATFSVEEDPLRSRARWLAARAAIAGGGLGVTLIVLGLARRDELFLLAAVPALLVYALLLPRARLSVDLALG